MADVFVSYARSDKLRVAPLVASNVLGRFGLLYENYQNGEEMEPGFIVPSDTLIPNLSLEWQFNRKGFTALAERLPPPQMIALMNPYFRIIDETIREHGGMIHSFIGDAVHASFNFADDCPEHARRALDAALAIQARLDAAQFADGGAMPTRIGVHTGSVAAAAIGSEERMNYAMFGDAVNVAMRIEQLNKDKGTRVLASAETVAACAPQDRARLGLHALGEVRLRGRIAPISIYEVGTGAPA